MRFIISVLIVLSLFGSVSSIQGESTLLIFLQEGDVDNRFRTEQLEAVTALAEKNGIATQVVTAADGLPIEVSLTPMLVLQSDKGRSYYYGRYSNLPRLENFMRIAKWSVRPLQSRTKQEVFVREIGRSKVGLPLKLTTINGDSPEADRIKEYEKIHTELTSGFSGFDFKSTEDFRSTDRLFYLDVHPYLSKDEQLYLSIAIFSQFNCIEPIYQNFSNPLQTSISELSNGITELQQLVETEIRKACEQSEIGDDFTPINKDLAAIQWADLGIETSTSLESTTAADLPDIPSQWKGVFALDATAPKVVFGFLPPYDHYSGEVKELDGSLDFKDGLSGSFEVVSSSVTMGDPGLDQSIHGYMISSAEFPKARIAIEKSSLSGPLSHKEPTQAAIEATFEMINKKTPVTVSAMFEPLIGENGEVQLFASGNFEVNITQHYDIEGPDGKSPENETLRFDFFFLMKE